MTLLYEIKILHVLLTRQLLYIVQCVKININENIQ